MRIFHDAVEKRYFLPMKEAWLEEKLLYSNIGYPVGAKSMSPVFCNEKED